MSLFPAYSDDGNSLPENSIQQGSQYGTMSLFPAYSSDGNSLPENSIQQGRHNVEKNECAEKLWLTNPSFVSEILDSSSNEKKEQSALKKQPVSPEYHEKKKSSKHKKLKSHHKHKRKKREEPVNISLKDDDDFYEDKVCQLGNLSVPTLSRPAIPQYRTLRGVSVGHIDWNWKKMSKKKKHQYRYYTFIPAESVDEVSAIEKDPNAANTEKIQMKAQKNDDNEVCADGTQLEEELSRKTAHFNKNLAEQPSNEELWLKYVQFQDMVLQFEKAYRRGDRAKGARVTAERKLAILDKALQHNPDSEVLLQERIAIAESVFPADSLSNQLGTMLDKQPSNLALWHGYIGTTQCSLAMCTVPTVNQLYNKAMTRLHQLRRGASGSHTETTEKKILALLHDVGIFLRQSGLWEQMWLLLRLYLELNLSKQDSNYFKIGTTLSDQLVTETEEQILGSKLPLSELWLRVEKLREGVHWLPWTLDEECEDPQRLVFSDDVSDFLHPITTASLAPELIAIVLMLLKVPLLPCRDTVLHIVNKYQKSWSFDTVELLLPAFFPMGTVDLECIGLFKDITELTVGPQYLEQRLGQEEYLEFVIHVFRSCAECLKEPARTAYCIWWLRFERLLIVLDRVNICKLPQSRKKKLKSIVKDFLKQEHNRNNLLFYREYALLEWELGHHEGACKIITTAISAQPGAVPVVSVLNEQDRAGLGSLYRTLCEMYTCRARMKTEDASVNKQKTISVLLALSLGKSLSSTEQLSNPSMEQLVAAAEKFHHIGTELLNDSSKETVATISDNMLPSFCVDWITCQGWFLFLTHSTWASGALYENVLAKTISQDSKSSTLTRENCWREAIFESYVNMLHHHCSETPGTYSVLREVLHRGVKEFPSNVYLLTTAAKVEAGVNGIGSPWWKLTKYFTDADSLMARVFLLLVARHRLYQQDELNLQTHSYLHTAGPVVPDKSAKNRLEALFTVLRSHPLTKRCPLLWRIYLRYLYEHGNSSTCKTAFYRAVEECPWVKALYMDAAKFVPGELPQVQDMIIEKELRLHVTPEELDILRSEPL